MPQRSYTKHGWQDDDDTLEASLLPGNAALAGLPVSWHSYDWWLAGLAFSAIWILDSWMVSDSLMALAGGLASLVVTLALCIAVHRLCRPHSARLAQMLCILTAVSVFIWHAF
jgi:hypothetical protein